MAELKFKKGDVVQLKSGGPLMTVQYAEYPDDIICTYFDGKNERQTEHFDQETLELDS